MTQAASGIDLFIPEVYDIVWSLIILVIVAVFFYKFFMPKFNAIFDERAAKIQGNIAKAEQARKDADEAKAKYEAQLSTARVDAAKIRDDARAEASHIIADARSRACLMRAPICTFSGFFSVDILFPPFLTSIITKCISIINKGIDLVD